MSALPFLELSDAELLCQCEVHTYRASGPGGQKRNKTSSAVRLHHRDSGLIAKAEEDRSQHVNKRRALGRLRMALATTLLSPHDPHGYRPSHCLAQFLREGRLALRLKEDGALVVINEVLGVVLGCGGRIRDAAAAIGISSANLVKFLGIAPAVWRKANHIRTLNDLRPLKGTK